MGDLGGGGGGKMSLQTISGDLERQLLSQDLAREKDSDEDGGAKTRVEFDSDFSASEEEENAAPDAAAEDDGKEQWSEILTKVRPKHNTGVKGVRADYEEAKSIVRRRNETKRLQDAEAVRKLAYGSTFAGESVSFSSQATGKYAKKYDADHEDNDSDSDGEDEFLAQYREQRMAQLSGFSQLPQFGRVIFVEKFAFLDEVDNADPRTFVVTHVYEEYIGACRKMNAVLDQFAAKHPHVKVLKLLATDASQTLSHRALPAFLVYKNKDMVNESSIGVNEHEFGNGDFGLAEVEWFFTSRYGIELAGVDVSEQERARASAKQGQDEADYERNAWGPGAQPTIGTVNLLGQRLARNVRVSRKEDGEEEDEGDDDW